MLVRSKRFRLLKKRTKKFCKLVAVVGQKASNIFTAGLLLASNFGMEVHGVADRQRPQRPRPTKDSFPPASCLTLHVELESDCSLCFPVLV